MYISSSTFKSNVRDNSCAAKIHFFFKYFLMSTTNSFLKWYKFIQKNCLLVPANNLLKKGSSLKGDQTMWNNICEENYINFHSTHSNDVKASPQQLHNVWSVAFLHQHIQFKSKFESYPEYCILAWAQSKLKQFPIYRFENNSLMCTLLFNIFWASTINNLYTYITYCFFQFILYVIFINLTLTNFASAQPFQISIFSASDFMYCINLLLYLF